VTASARIRSRTAVLGNGMYRLLFTATLGSAIGTYATTIALTSDIDARTHSTWWVALLFLVTFMPRIFVGLFIGPLIDRLSRKTLIVGSDLVRLAVFAVLPFAHHPGTMVVLAAAAGIADSFFRPAVFAGVPNLVDEHELDSATTLLQGTEWLAAAIGPLIAGTLVSISGAHIVYWINAATFLFSAIMLLRIPGRLLQSELGVSRGHWSDLREGLAAFQSSTALRVALYGFGLTMIASGLVNVSEIFLATKSLGSSRGFGYGLLWTGSGVGLVAGSIVTGFLLERHNVLNIYALAFVPLTAGIVGAATAPNIWIAATAMTMTGFGNGLAFPMTILIVQRYTSDRLRGRAFTAIISLHTALLGLAQAASGALTAAVGARWTYGVAAACTAGSALVVTSLLRVGAAPAVPREAPA
jgi:NRE family putative nickel resistance protein-like MFS transporter